MRVVAAWRAGGGRGCALAGCEFGLGDAAQGLDQEGAGTAAGVEHVDALVGESFGDVEAVAEGLVDAGDHVADDFAWGVPDAELFAEVRVEGFEEGFVEVLDGFAFAEAFEELIAVDAVEGGFGPVEDVGEVEAFEPAGVGEVVEEHTQDGRAQAVSGVPPAEAVCFSGGEVGAGRRGPRR